jgi:hypothetical protein
MCFCVSSRVCAWAINLNNSANWPTEGFALVKHVREMQNSTSATIKFTIARRASTKAISQSLIQPVIKCEIPGGGARRVGHEFRRAKTPQIIGAICGRTAQPGCARTKFRRNQSRDDCARAGVKTAPTRVISCSSAFESRDQPQCHNNPDRPTSRLKKAADCFTRTRPRARTRNEV